jgi:hypothetical protein
MEANPDKMHRHSVNHWYASKKSAEIRQRDQNIPEIEQLPIAE